MPPRAASLLLFAPAAAAAAAGGSHGRARVGWPAHPTQHPIPSDEWGGLALGLEAWEAFGFDRNVTVAVVADFGNGTEALFRYPARNGSAPLPGGVSRWGAVGNGSVDVVINGTESPLLRGVIVPVVKAILDGLRPADPASVSSDGVNRDALLRQGGGVTLLDVIGAASRRGLVPPAPAAVEGWALLRRGVDAWAALGLDKRVALNIGDRNRTLFTHAVKGFSMQQRVPGESLSKWPAAVMIAGLVAEGILSLDDLASKHLKWWTTDPNDLRSTITLRHLLSFQSGYEEEPRFLQPCNSNGDGDFLGCAHTLYGFLNHTGIPGRTWAYQSSHLQFAAAMAVAASGQPIDKLFERYLYRPAGMRNTTWGPPPHRNPIVATGITTTGADFEGFLRSVLRADILPASLLAEMDGDLSKPPVTPCGDGWIGHYGMGHWFECLGYAAGTAAGASAPLPARCLAEAIQSGPGAFGFHPLIDRKRGYYLQVVGDEDYECRSENPEYLRIAAKPLADAFVAGARTPTREELLAAGGGLVLSEISDMYNFIPPRCLPGPDPTPPPTPRCPFGDCARCAAHCGGAGECTRYPGRAFECDCAAQPMLSCVGA